MANVDGVEPERDFGQLNCDRIAVHPVDAVIRKVGFDLLLLYQVFVVADRPAGLALLPLQVSVGQLIHGFIQEGAAT